MKQRLNQVAPLFQKYDSPISVATRMAQFALESQAGTSELFLKSNNGFGIKASAPWTGDKVEHLSGEVGGARVSLFRKYPSLEASVKDHASFFTSTPYRAETAYKQAIDATNYKDEANALTGVYAGDPMYGTKLIKSIETYNLTQYDTQKGNDTMSFPRPKMIDRRKRALGYPGHGAYAKRSISAIKQIVRHYTAVNRRGGESNTIKAHEDYWRSHHGWDIGGYGIYIDFEGTIYHNYDFEIVTYGAGRLNPQLFHVCLEGSSLANHSPAQLKALDDVMLWLLTGPLKHLGGNDIRGHWEIPYNSTSCPGMTKVQLDAYRVKISKMIEQDWTGDTSQPDEIAVSKSGKYTVKHGDTLWAIAKAHDETVDNLQKWNKIADGQWLKTGQELYVTEPKQNAYTVVKGDYLYKIAQEHGVTVADLKAWNRLETNLTYAGQELFVNDPEIKNVEEPPAEGIPVEEVEVETPEDTPETPALELKENQYLRWDGIVVEVKEVK